MESKSREAFNAWFEPRLAAMKDKGIGLIRIYQIKNREWQAWQASRAALVVETPQLAGDGENDTEHDEAYNAGIATEKTIRAAGITVKGEGDEQVNS